jgi:hypothetical protein
MIPSLFTFTLLAALVFLAAGLPFLVAPARVEPAARAFPRHRLTGILTMLVGGGWFLWKIAQLGQSDFGDYKVWLFLLFAATLVGSILYVPDFLAVRGVAILALLSANVGLKSAFGLYDIPQRLVLVSVLYAVIVAALTYGIIPFKARDTVNWLYRAPPRPRLLGLALTLIAAALLIAALLY